ncbi:hypothetical protein O7614_22130 [Micromonospora sp. WMMD961]|uniref:hypothetical protein n=1 Tax=Micromonospora sp. WMMD961 TaxID=3016100 RepID=UPI002415DB83|nr:hypothetical protein [Micromonospora sp. WMMD961]MDG4782364.1 hypothetical protein [Micromonospora sp. WMMD961]
MPAPRAPPSAPREGQGEAFRLAASGVADATQIHTHLCYSEFGEVLPASSLAPPRSEARSPERRVGRRGTPPPHPGVRRCPRRPGGVNLRRRKPDERGNPGGRRGWRRGSPHRRRPSGRGG